MRRLNDEEPTDMRTETKRKTRRARDQTGISFSSRISLAVPVYLGGSGRDSRRVYIVFSRYLKIIRMVTHGLITQFELDAIYNLDGAVDDSDSDTRGNRANRCIVIVDLCRRFRSFSPGLALVHSPKY